MVSDSIKIGDREWSLDGLPEHMVSSVPHTCEVIVEQPIYDPEHGRIIGTNPVTHTVQLERDGKPLTRADRAPAWQAGVAEGWLPRVRPS